MVPEGTKSMYDYFEREPEHAVSRSTVGGEYGSSHHQEELHEKSDGIDVDRRNEGEGEEKGEEDEDTKCPSDEDSSRIGSSFSASESRRFRYSSSPSWQLASSTSREHTPTSSDYKPSHSSLTSSRGNTSTRKYRYYDGLDITGMCFDPWGERMYVAGVGIGIGNPERLVGMRGSLVSGEGVGMGAIVEWGVTGAEKYRNGGLWMTVGGRKGSMFFYFLAFFLFVLWSCISLVTLCSSFNWTSSVLVSIFLLQSHF